MEPMDVPKVGRLGVLRDPQGATFGIIKPDPAS
jgi:predicted enzyme related to lactoylglutathione lyase